MIIDLAGLLAAAALLFTLVALDVRRTASDTGQPARQKPPSLSCFCTASGSGLTEA